MALKTKINQVPERFKEKLREHTIRSPESTQHERIAAQGRNEKGHFNPVHPRPVDPISSAWEAIRHMYKDKK